MNERGSAWACDLQSKSKNNKANRKVKNNKKKCFTRKKRGKALRLRKGREREEREEREEEEREKNKHERWWRGFHFTINTL